jgi:hypothetical protein
MERRTLLGRLAALVTGTAVAGCTGAGEVPVTAPEGPDELAETRTDVGFDDDANRRTSISNPFAFREWDFIAGPDDQLIVTVTVENTASVLRTAPIRVTASTSDDEWVNEQFATVEGKATKTVRFEFSMSYETFNTTDPFMGIDFPDKTPTTPVPETTAGAGTPTETSTPSPTTTSDSTRSSGPNVTATGSETLSEDE